MVNFKYADVAQSVVHLIRNQKVASSNLAISSIHFVHRTLIYHIYHLNKTLLHEKFFFSKILITCYIFL